MAWEYLVLIQWIEQVAKVVENWCNLLKKLENGYVQQKMLVKSITVLHKYHSANEYAV